MLKDAPAMVSFSIDNLEKAKEFYSNTLGLNVDDNMASGVLMLTLAGGVQVMAYVKATHQPATYTLLNFTVNDIVKSIKELTAKGVEFLHYDQPDLKTDKNGVVDYGMMKIAFFNDPAGNNHAVMEMKQKD
ncbi:MAG TPA: VOC family protein [Candidatus Saccharimonadales bacterium]|nr:VOC family protein [Candidatus Saccharimonadales bacterium]